MSTSRTTEIVIEETIFPALYNVRLKAKCLAKASLPLLLSGIALEPLKCGV